MRMVGLVLALVGCDAETEPNDLEDSEVVDPGPAPECEDSSCLRAGDALFEGPDSSRQVRTWLPEDTRGAPVLFVWHHLDGSPEELLSWMPLNEAVEDGFVVVVPESRSVYGSEWAVTGSAEHNPDVTLFDDLVDALVETHAVDPERIYATGFSAGGLFTSYLTMFRADVLAATAPFSGGSPITSYATPSEDVPVMLSWGGPADQYFGFDFDDANRTMASELVDDGHVVLTCEHGMGHWLPSDATTRTLDFFVTHADSGTVKDFAGCDRLEP